MMAPLPNLLPFPSPTLDAAGSAEESEFDEVSGVRPLLRLVPRVSHRDLPDFTSWARMLPPEVSDLTAWARSLPPEIPDYSRFARLAPSCPPIPVATPRTSFEVLVALTFVYENLEERRLAS